MKKLLVVGLLLLSMAFALDYFVNGDKALQDTVEKVFADWLGLEPKLELNANKDAKNTISYGKTELFGPDTYSLSVQEQADESKIKVILNPSTPDMLERVIYHETGLLIGLETRKKGIMNPAISDSTAVLGELEAMQLSDLYKYDKADLNQDGQIDFYDLIELAKAFGQQGINSRADLNSDGVVDSKDLEILKESYVFGSPSPTAKNNNEESDFAQENQQSNDPFESEFLDNFDNSSAENQDNNPEQNNP